MMSDSQRSDEVGNTPPVIDPLIEEAAKKAAIAWLDPGGGVWCLWSEGALYVISGPGEQPAPGLAEAEATTVTLRGDHGGRIVAWPAEVTRVDPSSEEWAAVAPTLAAKRLNLPADEDTVARWAASCVLSRLRPAGTVLELSDASHAAPPPAALANRRTKTPFTLSKLSPLRRFRRSKTDRHSDEPDQTR